MPSTARSAALRRVAPWIISQHEGERLWAGTLSAFIQGNWVEAMLCAQATCERTLAALIYNLFAMAEPPKNWERWGMAALVNHCRDDRLVDDGLLNEVGVMCEERKPYDHWRGTLEHGALLKVAMDAHEQGHCRSLDTIMEERFAGWRTGPH